MWADRTDSLGGSHLEASRASDIPTPVSFASPPVNEVYLGVQFPGPVADEATTLADFWPRVREDYPTLERQAPIAPAVEDFSVPPAPPTVPFQVEVSHQPFPQRYWFVSLDGNELIQVQPDRFMLNWRQVQESDEYPRYQTLRPEFERRYETFLEALPEESRTAAVPEWCEVTYINHIEARGDEPDRHMPLHRVLRMLDEPPEGALPPPEDTQLQARHRLLSESSGEPIGRLYVSATPGFRATDRVPIYLIQLLARGRPEGEGLPAILAFFDWGRDLIVRGFHDMTTDHMHERWGLER